MRYLFRNQRSYDNVSVVFTESVGNGDVRTVTLVSNANFHQNIFSVGFVMWW